MGKPLRRFLARKSRREESGMETIAMVIVIPFIVVLIFALIDIGRLFQTRMLVDNIARDTVRQVAVDGGDYNPRTNTIGHSWTKEAQAQLTKNGNCLHSLCQHGKLPKIDCSFVTAPGGTPPTPANPTGSHASVVPKQGYTVSCVVTYPYRAFNQTLLNSPVLGLGMGSLIKPFTIVESARAETGCETGC